MLIQPVSNIQLDQLKVEWVPRGTVHPNQYNPNRMTYQDRMLLRQSILEDGWTQPIITLPDGTIVDGEQRWTVSGLPLLPGDIDEVIEKMEHRKEQGHPESDSIISRLRLSKERLEQAISEGLPACIASITGGLVPVTRLDLGDDAHKVISTIRHNRARGIHNIDRMAGLTQDLVQLGLDLDDLETRLGMDDEEIRRLLQSSQGQLADLQAGLMGKDYTPSTDIKHLSEMGPLTLQSLNLSQGVGDRSSEIRQELATRKVQVDQEIERRIRAAESEGKVLTQIDKDSIREDVELSVPKPVIPDQIPLVKLALFLTVPEAEIVYKVCSKEQTARGIVHMCRWLVEHEYTESFLNVKSEA